MRGENCDIVLDWKPLASCLKCLVRKNTESTIPFYCAIGARSRRERCRR